MRTGRTARTSSGGGPTWTGTVRRQGTPCAPSQPVAGGVTQPFGDPDGRWSPDRPRPGRPVATPARAADRTGHDGGHAGWSPGW
ncbi:hypothetical protein FTX61_14070 [Nitriliruptoraceae bacterium ZYF776]|nr:hypothetical protein [Profundirhabdus halotolerans]